jgi:hypothetical protein
MIPTADSNMAGKHLLQGLIKWSMRDSWVDRFEEILEHHLVPACDETGLNVNDIVPTIGEDRFTGVVWACAFEDFLTREFDDGENAIDDYLKRRGWKETASVRSYIAALRNSTMSLYEVSDIVRDKSFRARDLLRGGEPILISERSATRSLKPWDRIAARVVQVGTQMQICGGVLPFDHRPAQAFLESWHKFAKLSTDEKREFAKDAGMEDIDDAAIAELSVAEMLRTSGPIFTTFWLTDLIDRIRSPVVPRLQNSDGDELMMCEVRFPIAGNTTAEEIRTALEARRDFRPASETSWNWVGPRKPAAASMDADEFTQQSLTLESWDEDGALVLGNLHLEEGALALAVNSVKRSDAGCALLAETLGGRIGQPSIRTETLEQAMASRSSAMPAPLDIPDDEQSAIIHESLDRHYREVLDQPVPALGDETPRDAVKTGDGRLKVADWLKMMENQTAKSDGAMASYSFGWLWAELGISELRR